MLWVFDKRPTAEVIQVQRHKSIVSKEVKGWSSGSMVTCSELNEEPALKCYLIGSY